MTQKNELTELIEKLSILLKGKNVSVCKRALKLILKDIDDKSTVN